MNIKNFKIINRKCRFCECCDLKYKPTSNGQKYCSNNCRIFNSLANKYGKTKFVCRGCQKEFTPKDTVAIQFCGLDCSLKSEAAKNDKNCAFLNKYGVDNPAKIEEVQEKIKQTCQERYGVNSPLESEEIREKAKKTCIKRYGVSSPFKSEKIQNKVKQTCVKKYGVDNPRKSEEVKNKIKQTCVKKYGVEYFSQSEDFKEKSKQTCVEKYGVEYFSQSEDFKKKRKQTCVKKYGVGHPMQNREIFLKQRNSVVSNNLYKSINMRSSWEVAYAKYLDAENIEWEYEPSQFFINSMSCTYSPDFYLPKFNKYIEIKGWWRKRDREKYENFKKEYSEISIEVLMLDELKKLKVM